MFETSYTWNRPLERWNVKILLAYPYCLEKRSHEENVAAVPIGLYFVAALLRENGYDTEVVNWQLQDRSPQAVRAFLAEKKPDVLGLTILQANRLGGLEIAAAAKELNPMVHVVLGGVSATFLWEHFLTHYPQVDYVVPGEGEQPFLNLVRCLEQGGDPAEVRGVALRGPDGPALTPGAEPVKRLDDLPDPARHFTFNHLALTRGCPGNCTFCGSPRFWGRKVRFHSAKYFVDQMERLRKRGVNFFYVSDDTFTFNKKLVVEICRLIIERKLDVTWQAISRADCVSAEMLRWMRLAGCVQISFGVESGSEKIRRFMNKRISAEQIRKAFDLTASHGILPRAYFIYGSPGETRKTIGQSIDLIREIKPLICLFHVLSVFPGTKLYDDYLQQTGLNDDIWLSEIEDVMYFQSDSKLSEEFMAESRERLHSAYADNLPEFIRDIHLVDDPELYFHHADFCSRLGMTLERGELADLEGLERRSELAAGLYEKALEYAKHPRAYLGLGMQLQGRRNYEAALETVGKGLEAFPENRPLILCQGVNLMNMGRFGDALEMLAPISGQPDAAGLIKACRDALGQGGDMA